MTPDRDLAMVPGLAVENWAMGHRKGTDLKSYELTNRVIQDASHFRAMLFVNDESHADD